MDPTDDTKLNGATDETPTISTSPEENKESSKSQSSSASSNAAYLAARREARQRKILENSGNRLTKLTGREYKDTPLFDDQPNTTLYPDPEIERDTFFGLNDATTGSAGPSSSTGPNDMSILSLIAAFAGLNDNASGGFATILALILRTRVQYRILAFIVYILFANGIITKNILVPLLCWEINEVFLLKTYVPKLSFLSVVFTICGVAPNHVPTLSKIIETLHKVAKDAALFMYTFLVTHFVYCKVWLGQDLPTIFYSVLEKKAEEYSTT